MEKIFSIGEASKITGISVQTLRNYSNMGLVTPEKIDKSSGYRYYTMDQLHLLDKIKYLRDIDIPIAVITEAIGSTDNLRLRSILKEQQERLKKQLDELLAASEIVDWYIGTLEHQAELEDIGYPYVQDMDERLIIAVPYLKELGARSAEIELSRLRHSSEGRKLKYLRQFGYLLDAASFMKGKFVPKAEFMFIKGCTGVCEELNGEKQPELSLAAANKMSVQKDQYVSGHIFSLPQGRYLSFFDDKELYGQKNVITSMTDSLKGESLVLAIEYPEGLSSYGSNLICEYQIYIG